jgi:hypothetical protein
MVKKNSKCDNCKKKIAIKKALELAFRYGQIDGAHHKLWVIDQMVRELTGNDYDKWIEEHNAGDDGPNTYGWDEGIAP